MSNHDEGIWRNWQGVGNTYLGSHLYRPSLTIIRYFSALWKDSKATGDEAHQLPRFIIS